MSDASAQNEKISSWKKTSNWITRHPGLTELSAAGAFAALTLVSKEIPALYLFASGMAVSEFAGAVFQTGKKRPYRELPMQLFARGVYFVIGGTFGFLAHDSYIFSNSIPSNLNQTLAQTASACPPAQTRTTINVPSQDNFKSNQLKLNATVTAIDYEKSVTDHVTEPTQTRSTTTTNVADYSFRVAGDRAAKNFWAPGYSLQRYDTVISDIQANYCKHNFG